MRTTNQKNVIVKAKIKGEIVKIDLASESKTAYSDIPRPIEYLGEGEYYSYDNTLAINKTKMHFWRFTGDITKQHGNNTL